MNIKSAIYSVLLVGLLFSILFCCKKKDIKVVPTVTIAIVTNITATTATSGGEVTSAGGDAVTAQGVCWSTNQNPTTADTKTTSGTDTDSFTSSLTGLAPGTAYNIKAYAINSVGTGYSSQSTFTTLAMTPVLTTTNISDVTSTTATSGGNITSDGSAVITARGVCWSTSRAPTIANSKTTNGTGSGSFTSSLTGLSANTTYYLRAYATNVIGTAYGNENSVILYLNIPGTNVTDIDGNVYHTVLIGTQVWMVENLKTTKYRNGDPIPNVTGNTEWNALATGAYCWYKNDAVTYKDTRGALYNWYSVADSRNIAPSGWHVPSDAEWTTLTAYLGTEQAGGKLKEIGLNNWCMPNEGATNSSGFTALPGGGRFTDGDRFSGGVFGLLCFEGYWWSSSENSATNAWYRVMTKDLSSVDRIHHNKSNGFSVRCLRD